LLLLLAFAPLAVLILLPLLERCAGLPTVSEQHLTSAACYAAPVGGLLLAARALADNHPLQAGAAIVGGCLIFLYGKSTSAAQRSHGALGRAAVLTMAGALALTGTATAAIVAGLVAIAGLLFPRLLDQLGGAGQGEHAPTMSEAPAPPTADEVVMDILVPAEHRDAYDATVQALAAAHGAPQPVAAASAGWHRPRTTALLDRPVADAQEASLTPPPVLGPGQFELRRRQV
jgi:hypothetical protein